jgi:hypothetical protein
MIDRPGPLDQLFCPACRFIVFDRHAKKSRRGDGGGKVEVGLVSGPSGCGS